MCTRIALETIITKTYNLTILIFDDNFKYWPTRLDRLANMLVHVVF